MSLCSSVILQPHFSSSLVTGLSIEFMGVTYANNSAIDINEVGEEENAVLCRTDLTTCCGNTGGETRQGHWRYPDGTLVDNNASGDDIYRDRGTMVVGLHRRNSATTPTGQYCCEVPTMANPSSNAKICIILLCELVTLSGSGGVQVAGEDYTLTCQFTGGEAVTHVYRWLKDNSPLPGETSDTLSFSPLRETDSGGYTCEVTNGSLTATSPTVTITVVGKQRQ